MLFGTPVMLIFMLQGTGYAGFDGFNDAIKLNPRSFGGAFSVSSDLELRGMSSYGAHHVAC